MGISKEDFGKLPICALADNVAEHHKYKWTFSMQQIRVLASYFSLFLIIIFISSAGLQGRSI